MDKKYTWAVEDIYANKEDWEKDCEYVEKEADFSMYKGKLGEKKEYLDCMKKLDAVARKFEKVFLYSMLLRDSDTSDSNNDAFFSKAMGLEVKLSSAISFITPELTSLKEEILSSYIQDKDLSDYDYSLKCILKGKKHILSDNEENILALGGEIFEGFHNIFTKIDNADLPLKEFTYKGEKYKLSHGLYGALLASSDRGLRKKCFTEYYNAYIAMMNVISETYISNVKKDVFLSKVRKYGSSLEMALSNEDVDSKVYKNLISSVNKALPLLHKYMLAKKRALKLNKMHMYDVYTPAVEDVDLKLEYDEAYELVEKGLAVLGKDYVDLLKKAHDERWISVYETKGKRSGAYSAGVYETHPYVLLNYQKTTHEVFTIAHEMGHSIHTYFSNKNQPYAKAEYKIFVAEVASTVNEVLLFKHLLKEAKDVKFKKFLLSYLLEMIRTTLFRQTQFAEFEQFTHETVEKGLPLTKDVMCDKYLEINKKYYGRSIVSDDTIKYEWARIPHFYRGFYVYKYSTGIISALAIANRILTEGKPAVEDYFRFLSSGNSNNPVELLKIAGVDLTSKAPFISAFEVFRDTLNEFNSL